MPVASLALVVAVLGALLFALTVLRWQAARVALTSARRQELRYRAWANERRLFLDARTSIADAAQSTTDAVQLGSSITKAGHQAIADVPFGFFSSIQATSKGSKMVKGVHDGIADALYGAIAGVSEGIGERSRRRLTGEGVSPLDEDGSDPLEPPTPPARPPD